MWSTALRFKPAPGSLGALLCLVAALCLSGCDEPAATPAWKETGAEGAAAAPARSVPESPKPQPKREPLAPFRFVAYNVENWLAMDRQVDGRQVSQAPKPVSEKAAVVALLARHQPDAIGLCEIGTPADLREIQRMLATAGLELPHLHHTGGSDPVRHLGLLSRHPITATAKPARTGFRLGGRNHEMLRGILDATIQADDRSFRLIGVHLKSKRDVQGSDHEQIRRHEARLLRQHVDSILSRDPRARLIVYGDLNDTRPTPAFRTVTGNYNDPGYLFAVPAKDSSGHSWTHFWEFHEIYSRIDYVLVSRALKPETDFAGSFIIGDPEWEAASDHRPILAIFR